MTDIFTIRSETDGKFGIGSIPSELLQHTDLLQRLFHDCVPEEKRKASTYHRWYDELAPDLRAIIDIIKQHPFWAKLCDGSPTASFANVSGMDELYFSRTPREKRVRMLYGAAGNYGVHIDGIFHLPGIRLYRVLIGMTENRHVETHFPRLEVKHAINRGDYIVFDFDRARHKVMKLNDAPDDEYRILLKLHYCVWDNPGPLSAHARRVINAYVFYEKVTRYLMEIGTDPKTLPQFSLGLLTQLTVAHPRLILLYFLLWPVSAGLHFGGWSRAALCVLLAAASGGGLFFTAVIYLWIRYKFFKVR